MLRRIPRLVLVLLAVLLLVGVLAGYFYYSIRGSGEPQRSGTAQVPGLSAPVQVRWVEWGVPHLDAQHGLDLAYAIGWLHANDRLAQMDMVRRAVAGRLSEIYGPQALPVDRENRTLRLRTVAETMAGALSAEARTWLEAYSAGVNAWISSHDGDLPPQFRLLRYTPEPWTPVDSLSVVAILCKGLSFVSEHPEEARYIWLRELGEARARALVGDAQVHIPAAIAAMAEAERGKPRAAGGAGAAGQNPLLLGGSRDDNGGSNNWVIGASRSATGHPIVANDPHLGYGLPGVWYEVQMRSPELEVAGVTLPGLPGVVIGQNAQLAWGLTNNMLDDHDLYFEQLDATGGKVRRGEDWLPVEEEDSIIPVRGSPPELLRLYRTDRGPLLPEDRKRGLPPRSLAWTAYYPSDPVTPYMRLAQAQTLEEVPAALEGFVCPAQNLVVGHRDGGLLYTVLGQVPERLQGDGRFPMPGWDPSYGWSGLRPSDQNPTVLHPAEDLLVTANQQTVPADFPRPHVLDNDGPFRADRIRQMLLARSDWQPADVVSVQTDVEDLYARRILELLQPDFAQQPPQDPAAAAAWAALQAWNRRMELRGPSALFVLFERALQRRTFGDEEQRYALPQFPNIFTRNRLEGLLAGRLDDGWFDDLRTPAVEDRRATVSAALADAMGQGRARWGAEVAGWDYGSIHGWLLDNPMSAAPVFGHWFRRGPYELPGWSTTVCAYGGEWAGEQIPVAWGPSMRFVADTADPDRSLLILPAGQSGHPADEHYDDQVEDYMAGRQHAMYWSEAAIAAHTRATLQLVP